MKTDTNFLSYLAQSLERETLHTKIAEKTATHILYSITFFESRAAYEIMWKSTAEPGRSRMTIWNMHIVCWIPNSITHIQHK
jgi:hypothetical protein